MCDCFYCSFMIIFGVTLDIHVSSLKLIDYDEKHKLGVPIIINLGQQRHVGLGFLLKLELGTTFGLHVEWSSCFPLVFFFSYSLKLLWNVKLHSMKKLALKSEDGLWNAKLHPMQKACTRIRKWAPPGLSPHIENAQRECAITITFDLHSIPLHSHKFLCMLIVTCQNSS